MQNGKIYFKVSEIPKEINAKIFNNAVGTIYIIKFKNNLLKIGRSSQPKKRLSAISTSSPIAVAEIFVSNYHKGYCETEILLHRLYRENRLHGEFFDCEFQTVIELVNSLKLNTFIFTEEAVKKQRESSQRSTDALIEFCGFYVDRDIKPVNSSSEFQKNHCKYCNIPIDQYKPLKTYPVFKGCELIEDLSDKVFNREFISLAQFEEFENCIKYKYSDCPDFKSTLKEIFDIFEDLGIINNSYATEPYIL